MDTENMAQDTQKTFFAPGTVFEGTLTTPGDVEVAGEITGEIVSDGKVSLRRVGNVSISSRDLELLAANFKGDVTVKGDVIIDAESTLQGNIRSSKVLCQGKINGNLNVTDSVVVGACAAIIGDIKTPSLDVARGGKISGQVQMHE